MSSRAVRKLQKQQEQQAQHEAQDTSDGEAENISAPRTKFNAFDMLNAQGGEEEGESEASAAEDAPTAGLPPSPPKQSKSKKRKQKKKPKKPAPADNLKLSPSAADEDDIDRALKDLSIQQTERRDNEPTHPLDETQTNLYALLAVDPRKLNSINEMKRLFGNVVLESRQGEEAAQNSGRRRGRDQRQALDLARALTGQFSPASRGQSLSGVALRKNVLMQGKDEWPRAPSGGLGMEVVEKLASDVAEYKLVHNAAYRGVQFQFDICVESMEPERMIELLQFNPYHISTLLQVSEIAKHQGDHAVAADLLERALFNIGRSVHSSFGNRLKEGKARMDFNIKENREMWLSSWRYISNLGMKGTWKTAYEWAKLVLSLDPEDPYCMHLMMDNLAMRGREYSHFAELCAHPTFSSRWKPFPNIQCSLALAYFHLRKPKESREQLRFAVTQFPWIFCRLAQLLDIEPVPKQIWGVKPPNEAHDLLCEIYVARSKDIWNIPEVISLLMEVVDTVTITRDIMDPPEITVDIARHTLLSEISAATTYLPRHFVNGRMSASDPLPPGGEQGEPQLTQPASIFEAARQIFGFPGADRANADEILYEDFRHGIADLLEEEDDNIDGREAEGYLLDEGLRELRDFIQVNGVDRGNWEDDIDLTPLITWVRNLRALDPNRWFGYIESAADSLESSMVADLLLAELREQGEEWVLDSFP